MDKPYNRYVEDKIESFMAIIFKFGYNDNELEAMYDSLLSAIREDYNNKIITVNEYVTIGCVIDNLYSYAKHVCEDIREKEKESEDYNTGYNCGYSDAILDFTEKE